MNESGIYTREQVGNHNRKQTENSKHQLYKYKYNTFNKYNFAFVISFLSDSIELITDSRIHVYNVKISQKCHRSLPLIIKIYIRNMCMEVFLSVCTLYLKDS